MAISDKDALDALHSIPDEFRGVGGAAVIVSEGRIAAKRVWGYADVERRIPMTSETLQPVCSISKQMFIGLLVQLETLPVDKGGFGPGLREKIVARFDDYFPAPLLEGRDRLQMLEQLCDNHSGLRDYWALTTLWGADPEGVFSIAKHGPDMCKRLGHSYHFAPGTEYSYCNSNFHIVGRVLEAVTGKDLGDLLEKYIFEPAGMKTAKLIPDNDKLPPPCVPYDGDEDHGWTPAVNRIEWSGDAGVVASLEDMAAYEAFLDRSLNEDAASNNWYRQALDEKTWHYDDKAKTPAAYRRGLGKSNTGNFATYGHGGALRGFRLSRLHVPSRRLSVVLLLNHMTDSSKAAKTILQKALNVIAPAPTVSLDIAASPSWIGVFLDTDTKLHITITAGLQPGTIKVAYGLAEWTLPLITADEASLPEVKATLVSPDCVQIQMKTDNRTLNAQRLSKPNTALATKPFVGTYRCEEIDSVFNCEVEGSDKDNDKAWIYGSFDGFLGKGQARPMKRLGEDVWIVTCPRGMDVPAPGNWTAVFTRGPGGAAASVTIGCWLARKLVYIKTA